MHSRPSIDGRLSQDSIWNYHDDHDRYDHDDHDQCDHDDHDKDDNEDDDEEQKSNTVDTALAQQINARHLLKPSSKSS